MKSQFNFFTKISFIFITCLTFIHSQNKDNIKDLAGSKAMQDATNQTFEILELPSEKLENWVENKLGSRGKWLGEVNDDGSIYMIGKATTVIKPGKPGFITSRNIAFRKAVLDAKSQFVQLTGVKISSEEGMSLLNDKKIGNDLDAEKQVTFLDKIKRLANESVDKALIELGVSQTEVSKMNQKQKEKKFQNAYESRSFALATQMLKGLSICKIAEGQTSKSRNSGYEVAVVLKYTTENQALAAMIQDDASYYVQRGKPSKTLDKIKRGKDENMVPRLGVTTTIDSNGQYVVIAYGQEEVDMSTDDLALQLKLSQDMAKNNAMENLKNFVAQDIAWEELREKVEKDTKFQDGSANVFQRDRFEQTIKSKSSTLPNLRFYPIKKWRAKHPTTGEMITGVAIAWSKEFANKSRAVEETLNTPNSQLYDNSEEEDQEINRSSNDGIYMSDDDEDF